MNQPYGPGAVRQIQIDGESTEWRPNHNGHYMFTTLEREGWGYTLYCPTRFGQAPFVQPQGKPGLRIMAPFPTRSEVEAWRWARDMGLSECHANHLERLPN
jgi:hypothetical protein